MNTEPKSQPGEPEPEPEPEPGHSHSRRNRPRLPIRTYHCRFCSHLLVATTKDLLSDSGEIARRGEPALDRALIVPLPSRRALTSSSGSSNTNTAGDLSEEEDEDGEDRQLEREGESLQQQQPQSSESTPQIQNQNQNQRNGRTTTTPKPMAQRQRQQHYTILLSTTIPDRKPTVIRREDGFEKRILLRCGRCRVVMGYVLDEEQRKWQQRQKTQKQKEKQDDEDDEGQEGDKDDNQVAYILPGALVGTEDLGVGVESRGVDIPIDKNAVLQSFEREWKGWIK